MDLSLDFSDESLGKIAAILIVVVFIAIITAILLFSGLFSGEPDNQYKNYETDYDSSDYYEDDEYDASISATDNTEKTDDPYAYLSPAQRALIDDAASDTAEERINENGDYIIPYSWTDIRGNERELVLTIPNSTYNKFKNKPRQNFSKDHKTILNYIVTENDSNVIKKIADYFLHYNEESGRGDYETVGDVIAFIQSIPYEEDETTSGGEYFSYPVETLVDEKGDCEDFAILSSAILNEMGYSTAILLYLPVYDRGNFTLGHAAIGIESEDINGGFRYFYNETHSVQDFSYFAANRSYCSSYHPQIIREDCYFKGTVILNGSYCDAGYFPYSKRLFLNSGDNMTENILGFMNCTYVIPRVYTFVETTDKFEIGDLRGTDYRINPEILPSPSGRDYKIYRDDNIDEKLTADLRSPSPLKSDDNKYLNQSVSSDLGILVPDYLSEGNNRYWISETNQDSFSDKWYSSGVSFTYDDYWKLYAYELNAKSNYTLYGKYEKYGEVYTSQPGAWRIKYEILEMSDNEKISDMTPYSDVRFAVYKLDSSGTNSELLREFGWRYQYGAERIKSEEFYEDGDYYIAVFIRNCKVNIDIQFHGKGDDIVKSQVTEGEAS